MLDSAHEDALTGAFTRSYFFSQLRQNLHGNDRPVAYMQIDMDNLKVLNDSHGHGAGDAALVHLVKTLGTLMPQAIVGRLGGDEFGIAIAGQDNRAALIRLGDEVRRLEVEPVVQFRIRHALLHAHQGGEMDDRVREGALEFIAANRGLLRS